MKKRKEKKTLKNYAQNFTTRTTCINIRNKFEIIFLLVRNKNHNLLFLH